MRILVAVLALLAANLAAHADGAPPGNDAQGGGTLSQKLSNSSGVIKPKADVDPGIKMDPPATTHDTPVIPPPGTPGGDPNVTPK